MAISLSIFATQLLHGADYSNVTEETIVTDVLDYSGDIHITETGKLILENYAEFSGALSMDAGAKLYMVHFAQSVGDRDMSLVFGGAKVTTSGTYFHIYERLDVEATKTGAILTSNYEDIYAAFELYTEGDILVENFIANVTYVRVRSEERRVGKECTLWCRARGPWCDYPQYNPALHPSFTHPACDVSYVSVSLSAIITAVFRTNHPIW